MLLLNLLYMASLFPERGQGVCIVGWKVASGNIYFHKALLEGAHCIRLPPHYSLSSSTIYVRMHEAMNELAPGNHIKMTKSEEGSGRGAAIVAAIASRLNK